MNGARKKLIMIDDNIINLTLGKSILSQQYDIFTVPSGEKLFKLLEKIIPDLLLLDIEMPEMDGYEVMKRLKAKKETAEIPVIFLTIRNDTSSELDGLSLGAVDYITKPFSPPLLLKRIELHLLIEAQKAELKSYAIGLEEMVEKKTKIILDMQSSALNFINLTVIDLVEFRDITNRGHLERTAQYLRILVEALMNHDAPKKYREEAAAWDIKFMLQSSRLHDIGKISIRDSILLKPGKLTDEEFEEMKKHTIYGVQIISKLEQDAPNNEFLKHAKVFAGTHHERWDGKGYPYGLSGEAIPLQGRLMAIADVYDAIVSQRPYSTTQDCEEAARCIIIGRDTQFDPVLTDIFASVANQFEDANIK
jgi:putative two-component system response regulator